MRISDWSSDVCSADLAEAVALAQDGFPAQTGLVDLQQQAFEQDAFVALREAVFVVVVGPVQRVPGRAVAVAGGHGARLANAFSCGRPGVPPGFHPARHCRHYPESTGPSLKYPP